MAQWGRRALPTVAAVRCFVLRPAVTQPCSDTDIRSPANEGKDFVYYTIPAQEKWTCQSLEEVPLLRFLYGD